MEAIFKEILKQNSKIIRILTKVSEQHPKLSQEIDLALYASIKIQKTVNKYLENGPPKESILTSALDEFQISHKDDTADVFFNAAMQAIQNFKDSTFKLQRKMNIVLINQEESRNIRKITVPNSIYPPANNVEKNMRKKAKSKKVVEPQSENESSTHLSAIDASIAQLANEIRRKLNTQQDQSKNQQRYEHQ